MSDTKIISKSNGTHDIEFRENDQLQKIIEAESQKQKEYDMQFKLSHNELELLMSMDRIQAAIYVLNKCLDNERENFVGKPNHDIYLQIGDIITGSRKFYLKISSLKERLLRSRKT